MISRLLNPKNNHFCAQIKVNPKKKMSYQILSRIHHPRLSSCSSTAAMRSARHGGQSQATFAHNTTILPRFSRRKVRRNIFASNAATVGAAFDIPSITFTVLVSKQDRWIKKQKRSKDVASGILGKAIHSNKSKQDSLHHKRLLTFFIHALFRHLQPSLCAKIVLSLVLRSSLVLLNLVSKAVGFRERIDRIASLRCFSCLVVLKQTRHLQLVPQYILTAKH